MRKDVDRLVLLLGRPFGSCRERDLRLSRVLPVLAPDNLASPRHLVIRPFALLRILECPQRLALHRARVPYLVWVGCFDRVAGR